MAAAETEFEISSCVRGYHVYRHIWAAAVGEELECAREPTNASDRYSVAVIKDGVIVGHLPKRISRVCSLFLRRGGSILCTVVGGRRYSADLAQGGLEIPCSLLFKGKMKEINKLKALKIDQKGLESVYHEKDHKTIKKENTDRSKIIKKENTKSENT